MPYILQAVVNTSVDNTGRLVAAMGAKSLGPSVWGLDHPENVKPGCELPF